MDGLVLWVGLAFRSGCNDDLVLGNLQRREGRQVTIEQAVGVLPDEQSHWIYFQHVPVQTFVELFYPISVHFTGLVHSAIVLHGP